MSPPLQHQCQRGAHCVHAQYAEDGSRYGADTTTPDTLCEACLERLRRACEALPHAYVRLETLLDQQQRAAVKVSGTPEAPIPPRLDVLTLQAALVTELDTWAPPVAHHLGIAWPPVVAGQRPGPRVERAAHLLAHHPVLLVRLPAHAVIVWLPGMAGPLHTQRRGVDGAVNLLRLHQRAQLLLSGGSGDARLPVPCPSCHGVLLRRNGQDHVECQSCPRRWPESDYRRLCLVLAEDYRAVAA